ncbi:MAG: hypothetical protein Satyrvirus11_24 [Satyrvirus sp.]|uniref:Uncharacterized protein n=1 Tax=Satyrvirus sp. TaxID=2487771 RepID=A0A3G5ADT9_9VIRU|nr:MAG: hypothetical protein Satyrvirus11_24 [Satyrvirus sp.]
MGKLKIEVLKWYTTYILTTNLSIEKQTNSMSLTTDEQQDIDDFVKYWVYNRQVRCHQLATKVIRIFYLSRGMYWIDRITCSIKECTCSETNQCQTAKNIRLPIVRKFIDYLLNQPDDSFIFMDSELPSDVRDFNNGFDRETFIYLINWQKDYGISCLDINKKFITRYPSYRRWVNHSFSSSSGWMNIKEIEAYLELGFIPEYSFDYFIKRRKDIGSAIKNRLIEHANKNRTTIKPKEFL